MGEGEGGKGLQRGRGCEGDSKGEDVRETARETMRETARGRQRGRRMLRKGEQACGRGREGEGV